MRPAYVLEGDVTWVETDAGGLIHNTSALRWAEATEHAFYRAAVPELPVDRLPRRRIEATYHRPLKFRDRYQVTLSVEKLGRTSVTWFWTITSGGALCVEGRHVVVHLDANGTPTPWPQYLRDAVARLENTASHTPA
ncbi:acyl-CoA thioesterase [Streptomyces hokutonensis]|uniref:acyl-CoA thioesterase n=1 Tax=Streptomyces hokutonensis TaxID=1306990 RepID=UPI00380B5DAC